MTVDFTRLAARGREEFADFGERQVDDFGARFVDQGFRGADDEFDVAAGGFAIRSSFVRAHGLQLQSRFVEHPLDGAVEQDGVVEVGDLAVEPQVDAGDGGVLEVGELLADGCALGRFGKNAVEGVEGEREDEVVKVPTLSARNATRVGHPLRDRWD
jgi:hypothetical protein